MNGQVQISLDTLVPILLGCAYLVYTAVAILVTKVIRLRSESEIKAKKQTPPPDDFLENYCRITSADSTLKFVSLILTVVTGLTFALGYMKIFTGLVQIFLPDRMLGYTLLISYCGLTHSLWLMKTDLNKALHKLFT